MSLNTFRAAAYRTWISPNTSLLSFRKGCCSISNFMDMVNFLVTGIGVFQMTLIIWQKWWSVVHISRNLKGLLPWSSISKNFSSPGQWSEVLSGWNMASKLGSSVSHWHWPWSCQFVRTCTGHTLACLSTCINSPSMQYPESLAFVDTLWNLQCLVVSRVHHLFYHLCVVGGWNPLL